MMGQLRCTGAPWASHVVISVRCSHQCCCAGAGASFGGGSVVGRGMVRLIFGVVLNASGLGFFADDRRGRCPPCPTAARGGWAAKPNFGRTVRIDCWAAEGVGGWNRREIGFGVDWHRSPLLALRGAAVGGIRILLPNPSNHFQLSWTEKCTQERDRRKMVGRVGQVGHDSVSLDTPTPHRHISHDRVRRRGVGSRATGNRRSGRFYALRASVGHYRYTIHRVCTLLLGRGGLTLTPYPHPSQHRPSPSPLTLTLPRTDPHPHPSPSPL